MHRATRQPLILLTLVMLPLLACNFLYTLPEGGSTEPLPTPAPTTTPAVFVVTGEDFEAYVFSAEVAQEQRLGEYLISPNATGYWTPDAADIQTLEANIEAFVDANANAFYDPQEPAAVRLPDYARQYFGYERDGQRFIYGSFLCDVDYVTERPNQWVVVLDGGACFFQFHYDIATQTFFDLMVNGLA